MLETVEGRLRAAGIESAPAEARWIVEVAMGTSSSRWTDKDTPSDEHRATALALADRRAAGEPLQYVTGKAGFRHLELAVGPGVLVPRPETELVAEAAMARLPHAGVLVDVGTGCGAIALAVASERLDARVLATESSVEAMTWARRNRAALGARVELIACDLVSGLPPEIAGEVDVVVANLPYVAPEEAATLPRDVIGHEPREALFSPGGGLAAIERLARSVLDVLRAGGWLVLEIGASQGTAARALLEGLGYLEVAIDRDLAGRDRIAQARR
ncbi:MAG: peptide chain release factor N(5)-glutamine methyltransferase [Actinomycetota bacterium]